MEKSKVQVFTSVTCPHCPPAKLLVKSVVKDRGDAVLEVHSNATADGMRKSNQYGIQRVPTVLVSGPALGQTLVVDPLTENNLKDAILVTQGKKQIAPKKSLMEKLKGKII